jgi:predicted nucleic acid-binding protein
MLVLADRLAIDRVLTLDRRHFEAARTPSGRALTIVP